MLCEAARKLTIYGGLGWGGSQARGRVLNLGQRVQTFLGTREPGCRVEEGGRGRQAGRALRREGCSQQGHPQREWPGGGPERHP